MQEGDSSHNAQGVTMWHGAAYSGSTVLNSVAYRQMDYAWTVWPITGRGFYPFCVAYCQMGLCPKWVMLEHPERRRQKG